MTTLASRPLTFIAALLALASASGYGIEPEATRIQSDALDVSVDRVAGTFSVRDKRAGVNWTLPSGSQPSRPGPDAVRNFETLAKPHPGVAFETDLDAGKGARMPAKIRIWLPPSGADLWVEIEGATNATVSSVAYPAPLVPDKGQASLALSAYADGLLLPLRRDEMPRTSWGPDMPFFGVTDVTAGHGYACIFATPDDVRINVTWHSKDKDAPMAAGAAWQPSMGRWGYTRRLLYRFRPSGGYVSLAKAYREYAKETGILRTLREKMTRRPDVAKLPGAPDVWGADGLKFCQEAKAAGIDRMLVNGSWGIEQTEAIKKLGYLVSVYDNYEDIMAGKSGAVGDCKIPDDAPLLADGTRMLGWPVHATDPKTGRTQMDPKTGKPVIKEQYGKRCAVLDLAAAKRFIPGDQLKNPRNARFLDVTTATGLRECLDPKHYSTRSIDRAARTSLAHYISSDLGLVLGGEHGTWWGVPDYDYWEGMQSGGFYSWPAGHVGMDLPKTREEIGEQYLKYGIGCVHRIPLWELVFGDCTVSYWYWGDSTGHLYQIAPEIAAKQDLFNMLYGNPPLYWVNRTFGFRWSDPALRARLLDSYRNTCKLDEQTGLEEVTDHAWLTGDRTVQKSVFSSGITVIVNFSEKAVYPFRDGADAYPIAPLGFFAKGPRILQYRIRKDGRDVTHIRTPGYVFADGAGKTHDFGAVETAGPATIRSSEPDRLSILLAEGGGPARIRPGHIAADWDLASTHLFRLNENDERLEEVPIAAEGETIRFDGPGSFEMVSGKRHDLPSLAVETGSLSVSPEHPRQGDPLTLSLTVANRGRADAKEASVRFFIETRSPGHQIGTAKISVAGGKTAAATCKLDTAAWDGPRRIIAAVDSENRVAELIETDNLAEKTILITPDYARWKFRVPVEVLNGSVPQEDVPVVLNIDFGKEMKKLGGSGALAPDSVRIAEKRPDGTPGKALPCQFDRGTGFDARTNAAGAVVWVVPGPMAPDARADYLLLFDTDENGPKSGFSGEIWDAERTTATAESYRAVLTDGCISELTTRLGPAAGRPFIKGLVYSSGQTGWTREEDGRVESTDVLGNGPVRALVKIRKKLRGDMTYEKTCAFYPNHFDVHFTANKTYGTISRAYYGLEGTFEDNRGNRAKVDGTGDAEGVPGKCPDPQYYAVYAPGWAHSCIARNRFSNISYWDASSWGGIGLSGGDSRGADLSYVIHGGKTDAAFAKTDHARLAHPPQARIAP